MITLEDRLAAIERLIEDFRWARAAHESMPEHQTYLALKAIAVDLRAQMPNAAEKTRRDVGVAVAVPSVYRECDKLALLGFLTKESGGYQAVENMKINVVEG